MRNTALAKLIYDDLLIISGIKKKKPEKTLYEQIQLMIKATADSLGRKTSKQLGSIILEVEQINKRLKERMSIYNTPKIDSMKAELEEMIKRNEERQKIIDGFKQDKH